MQEDDLLQKWEEAYKKGLLSFWILLLLAERPSYPFEMNPLIQEISQGTISADDNSLYRALGRFENVGIVVSEIRPSAQGPNRRYYRLTGLGRRLLQRFIERNILVFESPAVAARIQAVRNGMFVEEEQ